MRARFLLFAGAAAITVITALSLLNGQSDGKPVLVFKGYRIGATNGTQLATFELCNASSRAIWLFYSGTEFPLRAQFLERPMVVPTKKDNTQQTNVYIYSVSVGSFFMQGQQVLPRGNLILEFPLIPGQPVSQVGICCYEGKFSDGNDFLNHLRTFLLDRNASLKEKGEFYWENARRRLKAPKRYEIWCPQPVCFQASASNPPTAHPVHPGNGGGPQSRNVNSIGASE